jgi:hypothetical protein
MALLDPGARVGGERASAQRVAIESTSGSTAGVPGLTI